MTITPGTDLPVIFDTVTIDGTTQPGYTGQPLIELSGANDTGGGTGLYLASSANEVRGLIINRFTLQQVLVGESSDNIITRNHLGTNAAGTAAVAGGSWTVRIRRGVNNSVTYNVIAGTNSAAGGVDIEAGTGSASGNTVAYNRIGVGADGGVLGSAGAGIYITADSGGTATGNLIAGNMIASNSDLGIDLGNDGVTPNDADDPDVGPNNLQNFPVITSALNVGEGGTLISGTLNSTPNSNFRIEFFSSGACDPSGYGEGEFPLGTTDVTTNASGDADFNVTVSSADQVTATASNLNTADTSEFSACQQVAANAAPSPPTGVTAGAGDAQAQVSWIPPDSDGGSPIAFYTISSSPETASTPMTVSGETTTATVSGLGNGTDYTFTVTATNQAELTSDPSAPSQSVRPTNGAPPPEAATSEVPAGGSLSTGGSASPGDPTNTTVNTPNAGTVSIGEGAMTGNPPAGVQYVGQQVDITAPDATAQNPMTFTFVTDCSVLPPTISICSATATAMAAAASGPVKVKDYVYQPRTVTTAQGQTVTWSFLGPNPHSVTDMRSLGAAGAPLFDSGSQPAGTTYSRAFPAAGGYPYHSTVPGDPVSMQGTVRVPLQVSQSSGSPQATIVITWASSRPDGYRFDAQYRFMPPDAGAYGAWTSWRSNTSLRAAQFIGEYLQGKGTYQFRARLENSATRKASLWSLPSTVTIGPGPARLGSVSMFHESESGANAEVPDCTGPVGVAQPAPSCVWSERILPDGDLEVTIFTTRNGRWRTGALLSGT